MDPVLLDEWSAAYEADKAYDSESRAMRTVEVVSAVTEYGEFVVEVTAARMRRQA